MDKQTRCPVCSNLFVAEFYEPRGTALCLHCGATLRRLRDRLVTLGKLDSPQIDPHCSFIDDMSMNPLDIAELVMALEEEGVELTDEGAREIKTVKDAIRVINQHRSR